MEKIIYQDKQYKITHKGNSIMLTNGNKAVPVPLQAPGEMPDKVAEQLKKAGANPADYFFVGTLTRGSAIRIAALKSWNAAVAEEAEKTKKEMKQARPALVFHDSYLIESSLVMVRPATDEERAKVADWLKPILVCPVGDWTSIDVKITDSRVERLEKAGELFAGSNVVYWVTEKMWDILLDEKNQQCADKKSAKAAAKKTESDRIESARAKADRTGEPVEIEREMVDDDSVQDNSFSLWQKFIRADGSTFTTTTPMH